MRAVYETIFYHQKSRRTDPSGETAIARISGEVKNVHQRYDALAEVPRFFKGCLGNASKKKSDGFLSALGKNWKKVRGMEDQ